MAEVRGYRPEDAAACRALWVDLTEHHRTIYRAPHIGGDDPGRQFDEHLVAVGPERLWVAELDGVVMGLTGLIVNGTEAEIEPVIVAPGARGLGIGRALVGHVLTVARTVGIRTLSARPVARNCEAIRFFRDAGFDTLGRLELFADLAGDRTWEHGETIAGREFLV